MALLPKAAALGFPCSAAAAGKGYGSASFPLLRSRENQGQSRKQDFVIVIYTLP
jgi:hypothetical protein